MKSCPICTTELPENTKICPSCGFKIIEGTQEFKPVEVAPTPATTSMPETSKATQATLKVIRGPQIDMEYPLSKTITSLGRNPKCDIFLNDMTVSREHALIALTDEGYVITDRNSFNGTWVNNQAVTRKVLTFGDMIQIGVFCLKFNLD